MKINIEKLSEAVNNPNLPSLTIPTSETIAMMANYSGATSDMTYFMQKFLDSIDIIKDKIILMRCPCLASTVFEAMLFDPISAANKGNIIPLSEDYWDSTTRTLLKTRINNWFNDNYVSAGATINNLSVIDIDSYFEVCPALSTPAFWAGIGWGDKTQFSPRGQWNNIENSAIYAYLYSNGQFTSKEGTNDCFVKDGSVLDWFDFRSVSGTIIIMQGATKSEFETVMAAAKEFVDNINSCWA